MTHDNLSIALVFALLAGGTAAVGSEIFATPSRAPAQVAAAAVTQVTLPTVVVIGRRQAPTVVAAESASVASQSVQ